ncbi:hypothetical protein G7K_0346-t1 [Saitoella complicata NRRL Y-17804]|uniref:Pentatricopeptide repeat-containing protein-mitochondrial domain-containing protein n=2 Tax=Saitoella complicata (strain BCRC 22490 / CBS 7301 / JCM 7358 / NBRC 10748 / NRRL Y-17804) TaxID=698492 RepID=A0A0E9N8S7_SAICN|nr:hypothetical protein G7K_0346-t1 [Saitoella complicata NRRL Y-17804]
MTGRLSRVAVRCLRSQAPVRARPFAVRSSAAAEHRCFATASPQSSESSSDSASLVPPLDSRQDLKKFIVKAAHAGQYAKVFTMAKEMAAAGEKADTQVYNSILCAMSAGSDGRFSEEAVALMQEMEQSGCPLDRETWNWLLEITADAGDSVGQEKVLEAMSRYWVAPDSYWHMFRLRLNSHQYERAIELYDSLKARRGSITPAIIHLLLHEFISIREPSVVRKLMADMQTQEPGVRYPQHLVRRALSLFADTCDIEGLLVVWPAFKELNAELGNVKWFSEGLALRILLAAGRHGKPDFATEILRAVASNAPFSEPMFASLLEAYIGAGDAKNAFMVLPIMRQAGVTPTLKTAFPLVSYISKDIETVDRAFFTLQDLQKEHKTVDLVAVSAVIKACIRLNDLERAVSTLQDMSQFKLKPDSDTYDMLLAACAADSNKNLSLYIAKDMASNNVAPTAATFTHIIGTSLWAGSDYEEAFVYLEEMKAAGFKPSQEIYTELIRKCVIYNDGRATVALEEMQAFGYETDFVSKIISEGQRKSRRADEEERNTQSGRKGNILDALDLLQ